MRSSCWRQTCGGETQRRARAAPTARISRSSRHGPACRASSLRRLAPSRCAATSLICRRQAALRTLFKSQREHGRIAENPAELVATPRRPSRLPRLLSAREAAGLLDSIPGGGPLELRDRAMFELAYGCGLRAEELVSLQVS